MSRPSGLALLRWLCWKSNHGFLSATLRPEPGTLHENRFRAKVQIATPRFLHTRYDAADNLTSLEDAEGNLTQWEYNALNWVTEQIDPNDNSSYYLYNSNGQLTQLTDRDERVTNYVYDRLGRKTQETWKDYAGGPVTRTFDYTYYKDSRLDTAANAIGANSNTAYDYDYDHAGRATSIEAAIAGLTPDVTLAQQFDYNSNRSQLAVDIDGTSDFVNDYQYANNRMVQVRQSGLWGNPVADKLVNIGYNADGQLGTIARYADAYGGTLVASSTYAYDGAARLTGLTYAFPEGSDTAPSYTWAFDNASRITQFVSSADGTKDYVYDHVNQLTDDDTQTYAYDETGNRTGGNYDTDVGNRMTYDAQGNYYEYDYEGNRIRVTAANGQSKTEYSFDNRNRLTEVRNYEWDSQLEDWVQGKTVDYQYDVFDRLVGKTVSNEEGESETDSQEAYVYDGQNVILQFHKDGSGDLDNDDLSRRFLNGPAVDQVFAEEVLSGASSVETRWLLADNQGTVRDVAVSEFDDQEDFRYETKIKDHLIYDGFGNFTQTDANYQPAATYAGYRQDADTGLFYTFKRWYDANTGRWLSEDPLGFSAGDVNLSRYCGNSPTNFTDPSGMQVSGGGGWAGNGNPFAIGDKEPPPQPPIQVPHGPLTILGPASINDPHFVRLLIGGHDGVPLPAPVYIDGSAAVEELANIVSGPFVTIWKFYGGTNPISGKNLSDEEWLEAGLQLFFAFEASELEGTGIGDWGGGKNPGAVPGEKPGAIPNKPGNPGIVPEVPASPLTTVAKNQSQIVISRGMKTVDLTGKWRKTAVKPGGIVYVLRDKTTGELLKVGQTTAGNFVERFDKYATVGRRTGRKLEVDLFEVAYEGRGRLEGQIRRQLGIVEGVPLPWDNTGTRLGRPGLGIPK